MGAWISVKERMPDAYQKVRVLTKLGKTAVMYHALKWTRCKGETIKLASNRDKITHWMPLKDRNSVEPDSRLDKLSQALRKANL